MKQGKCDHCKRAYKWERKVHSRLVRCPLCNIPLKATLYFQKRYSWIEPSEAETIYLF